MRSALAALRFAALLLLVAVPATALELEGSLAQGGLVVGRVEPGTRVALDGDPVRVTEDGAFLIGFGRDHGPEARLELRHPDGTTERRALAIEQRDYLVQRIDGLPPSQVTPDEGALRRIREDREKIVAVRRQETPEPYWRTGFVWPVLGRISGVYGSQRILNGEPRQPHFGVDIAAPEGTPIGATADGTVVLSEPDMFFTGHTVMIDHGHGLTSIYAHMASRTVAVGDAVAQGQVIGSVGMTGRATGPHLHWGMNLFAIPLDPALLVPPMPES